MSIHPTIRVDTLFDRSKMQRAADRMEDRTLKRTGAYGRTVARRKISRRKSTSAPGQTPTSRTGRLKNAMAWDHRPARGSVFIGPRLHRAASARAGVRSGAELLEFGGRYQGPRGERGYIAARPFMRPTLEVLRPWFVRTFRREFVEVA